MQIVRLSPEAPENLFKGLAALHERQLAVGGLAILGPEFLALLYKYLAGHANCILVAAVEDNNAVGFVCGTLFRGGLLSRFALRHGLEILAILLFRLIRQPSLLGRILPLVSYMFAGEEELETKNELLSIAVDAPFQRQGIARKLVAELSCWLQQQGQETFMVSVSTTQENGFAFYQSIGGQVRSEIKLGPLVTRVMKIDCANLAISPLSGYAQPE